MELRLGFFTFLQHLIYFLLRPIFAFIYRAKPPSIPPIKNPLLKLSATTLAKKIREGEISSQTVVEAYIERIREVNPFLNAVVEDRFVAALNEAKGYDEKLKAGEVTILTLEKEKPLYGVPITVKESCALKGMSHTGGTVPRQGVKASEDCPAVESLRNAGAIPLCVTNTPELCSTFYTANLLFGRTCNPYDTRKTPGGSTGGEGAIIGAGGSLIGVGSDVAGSIRVPAHFNGVFGHKPTPGIIPIKGHFPMSDNDMFQKNLVLGPLTRYAEDLQLAVKVMSSKCGRDLRLDEPIDLKNLRVFYADSIASFLGGRSTTADIREKIKVATNYLAGNGASVQQFPKGWLDEAYNMEMAIFFTAQLVPQLLLNPKDPKHEKKATREFVKAIFGLSEHTKATIFMQLMRDLHGLIPTSRIPRYTQMAKELRENITNLLKDNGIFIFPTFPSPAISQKLIVLKGDSSVYCALCNNLQLPSTHVPMGLNKEGLPVGFQVIAGPYQDRLCLAVARELEKAFGGWIPPANEL